MALYNVPFLMPQLDGSHDFGSVLVMARSADEARGIVLDELEKRRNANCLSITIGAAAIVRNDVIHAAARAYGLIK